MFPGFPARISDMRNRFQLCLLDSLFARPGSAPIWGGKKGEFRDWTNIYPAPRLICVLSLDKLYKELVKQSKIRDWETKRNDLNNKLEVCEEKLRNPEQGKKPDNFKVSEGLLTAAIGELCV